jgi:ribonuclease E
MAEPTPVALAAAPIPSSADIARAEKLVRDRFVHPGEDPAIALAAGSPRRRALDWALEELDSDPKTKHPSTAWRREFSLLLGLERLLSDSEPKLADGTVLSAHQVDALSGTLTALLAEAQRATANGNGRAASSASPELLASADILGPEDVVPANDSETAARPAADLGSAGEDEEEEEEELEDEDEDDEDDDDLGPVQRAAPEELVDDV